MNWKSEAVEKLRQYDAVCCAVRSLPDEIHELEYAARSLRSPTADKPRGRSGPNAREDALMNNLVLCQELKHRLDVSRLRMERTAGALKILSPEERRILELLYIRPEVGNLHALCQELQLEQSSVYRRRDQALRNFTAALYGVS